MTSKQLADPSEIERLAHDFIGSNEPISFYDAFLLVRLTRRVSHLTDRELHALIAVHDHLTTTDGGRSVLADLLRGCAQRHDRERALAAKVLTPRDHGKTVRARVGARLLLDLADTATAADAWSVTRFDGAATLTRLSPAESEALHANVAIALCAPGSVALELVAPSRRPRDAQRQLTLYVIVEP